MKKKLLETLLSNLVWNRAWRADGDTAPVVEAPKVDAPSNDDDLDVGGESNVDWAAESTGMEEDGGAAAPAVPTAAPAAKPAQPAPAAAAPAVPAKPAEPVVKPAEAPAAVPVVAAPAAAAVPAAAPVVAPAAPAPAPAAETAEAKLARETAEKVETEKTFNKLVEYYKLPEDMEAKLQTEPEKVLPFMAARLHETMARQVAQVVAQLVPNLIRSTKTYDAKESEAEKAFYGRWSNLNKKDHHDAFVKTGTLYRQLNPSAKPEEAIEAIGKIISESLGIQPPVAAGAAAPAAPAPAARHHQPAGSSAAAGGPAAVSSNTNEFSTMAEAMLREDG